MDGRPKKAVAIAALAGTLALGACGSSVPVEDSTEYQELVAAESVSASDLAASEEALAATEADLAASQETLTATEADLATSQEMLTATEADLSTAQAEAETLRIQYDPQVRAELQAAVDAEVFRATSVAIVELDTPIEDVVQYDDAWAPVASEQDVIDAVTAASAAERSKSAEEREAERLAGFTPVNVDAIVKDPFGTAGNDFVMYASIVQYDSNTGTCAFHANFAAEYSERSYNYDERAQFGFGTDELEQVLATDCPQLDGIDVDDFVKVWATGAGAYSYDTSIGGSNTVPLFDIVKVELVKKD